MTERRSGTSTLKFVLAGILMVIVMILVVQNQAPMNMEVLVWSVEAPAFVLLAFLFLAGVVTGYVLGRSTRVDPGR